MEPAKSAEQRFRERQELFKKLWTENQWLCVFWGIAIGVLITAVASGNESVLDVLVSFAPEFVGLLFVTVVLDRRAKYREREQRKQQLIRDIRSRSNDFALRAVNELRHERWLTDGTLQNADLSSANLQNADLSSANLQNAGLSSANLQNADLSSANLQNAKLGGAELQGAKLGGAELQGANLVGANLQGAWPLAANLQGANLVGANLQGAILVAANLQNAKLWGAELQNAELGDAELQGAVFYGSDFNEKTLLPDGSYFGPQRGPEQLERFTNSNHPDFWRSDSRISPAYRGDLETTGDE